MHATAAWVLLLSGAAAIPQLLGGLPLLGAAPLPVTSLANSLGSVGSVADSLQGIASGAGLAAPLNAVAPVLSRQNPQAPSAYSVSGAVYLGFFISVQSVRVPNGLGGTNTVIQQLLTAPGRTAPAITLPNLTWQTCSAYCATNGFRYAGVEGRNTCRCGSAFAFTPVRALNTVCGLTCSGSASQCCGALNRLILFQILSPAPAPPSQPAASTTPRLSRPVAVPNRTPLASSPAVIRPTPASSVPALIRPSSLPAARPTPLPTPVPARAPLNGLPAVPLPSLSVVPALLREINSADVCIARLPAAVRQAVLTSCFS